MNDGSEFDSLFGDWHVRHSRLQTRLAGACDWQEFSGQMRCMPVLGGCGNVDDNLLHLPAGDYHALSIRSFNRETRLWSIWWLDGRSPDRLDAPVVGAFSNGIGTFHAEDIWNGKPIRVRFEWTRTSTQSPRWSQAFSDDAGLTWEDNWTMDFQRD